MRDLSEIGFSYPGLIRERPAPSEEQLAITEERVGQRLPDDYRQFLARQNGGVPGLCCFTAVDPEYDDEEDFVLEAFYYVDGSGEDYYDVESASESPSELLEEEVVAIAGDGSGDQLLLRLVDGAWQVQWWRHDQEPGDFHVADSFSELLDMLGPEPEW